MDKKLKKKWLKALRSGEYKQCNGALANTKGTAFCCLGVLADIQGCRWEEDKRNGGLVPIDKTGKKIV